MKGSRRYKVPDYMVIGLIILLDVLPILIPIGIGLLLWFVFR